jgi:anthranilate synthase component 2
MHGKQSTMTILENVPIFEGLERNFKGARYHSLSAKADTIPDELIVIAVDEKDDEVMAVKHRDYDIYGLQFHPESVLTPEGKLIVQNFLNINQ